MSSLHTICDYVGREGPCGRGCYAGRCFKHRHKTSMKPCIKCGRGTASVTGYCHKNCTFKQVYTANKAKRERDYADALNRQKRAEIDAQAQREREEMNEYIDSLFSEDDPKCLTLQLTQRVAECATSG